jgi:hypothetical protein
VGALPFPPRATRVRSAHHPSNTYQEQLAHRHVWQNIPPQKCINCICKPIYPHDCAEHDSLSVQRHLLPVYPTHMGNMPSSAYWTQFWAVHPRASGEHMDSLHNIMPMVGSSPHLRGTLPFRLFDLFASRFIPAPAGNIWHRNNNINRNTVHPRTCGEHLHRDNPMPAQRGSSPHLRGTSLMKTAKARYFRFIPAPAGNILPLPPQNH